MPGLPKIAIARLKANPGAPKSSGVRLGPGAFQGAEHPDANLLAAFVEEALTESERTQVMNHLVQCAECREVAAFTLPAEVAVAGPTRLAAGRHWSHWPVLRWGAMAAVVGTLTVIVVLHPGLWKGHYEISKEPSLPAPSGNITSARQSISPAPPAQLPPETAQAKAQLEARESGDELAATKKAPGSHQGLAMNDQVARAKAKQQVTMMASSRQAATFRTASAPAVKTEQEESRGGNELTAGALSAPALPPAPAPGTPATSDGQVKLRVESQSSVEPLRATTQSVAVSGGNAGASSAEAPTAKTSPRVSTMGAFHMTAQANMGQMQASRKGIELGAPLPAALWSVSSDGKVQRSTDDGKSFEQIYVAGRIKFRAIAALGNDIWTGGTRGALFHSVDGGVTWTQAAFNVQGNTITEAITGIQLHDPLHLTIVTASGSQWVSGDGGQHWQKQP